MNITKVSIEKVIPWDKNPRGIKTKDYERLKKQILKLGVYKPLVCYREKGKYIVLGGNMRIRALKELGIKDVDISIVEAKTEAKKIEYALSDNNRVGFYEEDRLAELVYPHITELDLAEFKVDLGEAIDLKQVVERYGPDLSGQTGDLLSPKDEPISGMDAVWELKQDIRFDGAGPFDMPILREDRLLDIPAPNIWAGPHATDVKDGPYLYNYGTDSILGLDFSKTVVSFYTEDARFERLWSHASEIAGRFLNRKVLGIVSPNFSTYFKWPRAMRLYNIFRSRWVARYMQEVGIRVVPDIAGDKSDIEFMFDGIPLHSPICIQIHRKIGNADDHDNKNDVIQAACDTIKPKRIWVYGKEERAVDFPALKKQKIEFILPREWAHKKHRLENKEKLNG